MTATGRKHPALEWVLVLVAVAGLAIDAYVHFHLAPVYAPIRSNVLNEGELFRAEATVAVMAAAALLVRPRRYTAALAFVVSAGGTAAVLVYAYVDVGAIGPLPDMYDPLWYAEKTLSAVAEGIAAVASLALFALLRAGAADRPVPGRVQVGSMERCEAGPADG